MTQSQENNIVLVTGGAGYIGSHVCQALKEKGFLPVTYDNLCTGNRQAVKFGPFEEGDLRDRARLAEVMAKYKPVAVMHFAALIQVAESVEEPAKYYDNNVYGSFCLLEEARAHGIENMVFSSTAAVYGNPEVVPLREDHPKKPINPYGQTKLAMEGMIRDYATAYGSRFAILRYFNAAGADLEGNLGSAYVKDTHITALLTQVAAGMREDFKIFGTDYDTEDGTAVRDYVHIADLAEAHILSLKHIMAGKESLTLNLGTNSGHSVRNALEAARKVTGHPIPAEESPRRAGDPPLLVADATQARQVLGWEPKFSDLETIIGSAWAWRKKQLKYGRQEAFNHDGLVETAQPLSTFPL